MDPNQGAGVTPWTALGTDAVLGGRYRLTRRLGRGGMADVWAAEDGVLDRPVAVKIFRFDAPGADQERIAAEMRTLAQLSHPGIVNVYDAGSVADPSGVDGDRVPYLVMELVEGETLRDRLTRGPLSPDEARNLAAQLGETLAYLHRRGVVHRDIKPANILLHAPDSAEQTAAFRPRLTDFGVARLVDSTRITEIGMTIGTANYVSPEQATGSEVGPPSDIYSFGLVLLEALTGQVAYPGSGVSAAAARLHRPPHVPETFDPQWVALLTAMTDPEPSRRPTADEVTAELSHSPTPAVAVPPVVHSERSRVPTATEPTKLINGAQSSSTRLLPTAARPAVEGQRGTRRWWSKPGVLAVLLATVIVVVLIAVFASQGGDQVPVPRQTSTPAYPTVSGQVGQHLRDLEGAVG